MRYVVEITRKSGLADPEGTTTAAALTDLGYSEVASVSFGRTIHLEVADDTSVERIDEMCRRLLANPVIEDYSIEAG
jgi:phosphoribosylformylglycinamidine synthase subunit PurS